MVRKVNLQNGKYSFPAGFSGEIPARVAGEERWRRKMERVDIKENKWEKKKAIIKAVEKVALVRVVSCGTHFNCNKPHFPPFLFFIF